MPAEPSAWNDEFNVTVKGVERFLNITTASEIQADTIELLDRTLVALKGRKECAIRNRNEAMANMVLGCECVATTLQCELQMWVALKKEDVHAAWDLLIAAQSAAISAARAHPGFRHWAQYQERLVLIQELMFPRQLFSSPGGKVIRAQCSICDAEYGVCDHIRGRAYMGEFCHRIIHRMELSEVSLVEEPANKLCRVVTMCFEGTMRDTLTWRATQGDD